MVEWIPIINTILALGTIALLVGSVGVLFFLHPRWSPWFPSHITLPLLCAITTSAAVLTLVYSELFGFIPCGLCWFERAMLYPQALILMRAWKRNDVNILPYIFMLSIIGALIALYHHYLQIGGVGVLPCPASGNADCGKRLIFEFGFVTFPLMAFAVFVFTAAVAYVAQIKNH